MAIWNKIVDEFERAGRAANSALDEGKLRLTLMRARQSTDHSAERLGYAVFRAKAKGEELAADQYNRHASELAAAEAEIARLETLLKEAAKHRSGHPPKANAESEAKPTPAAAAAASERGPHEPEGAVEP